MKPTVRSALALPETAQYVEVNADEPVVITHYGRPVAVLHSWETWQAMKQALEAK